MWHLPAKITDVLTSLNIQTILMPHRVKEGHQFIKEFCFPEEVILVSLNQTETLLAQELLEKASIVCFIKGRIVLEDGEKLMKPLQGSIAYYMVQNPVSEDRKNEVRHAFNKIGVASR